MRPFHCVVMGKPPPSAAILGVLFVLTLGGYAGLHRLLRRPPDLLRWEAVREGAEYLGRNGIRIQKRSNDCGPAALAMILDHFGIGGSIDELGRLAGLGPGGTSMLGLKRAAERKGLRAEGWRLSFRDLRKAPLPAIALVRGNHFVVVTAVDSDGRVYVSDPSLGRLRFGRTRFLTRWRGETLLFRRESKDPIGKDTPPDVR